MTLQRIAIPSPNFSSRGGSPVKLAVIHTAEGSRTIESLGSFFASPSSGVSSHAGADDKPGTIGVFVKRADKAWTQGNANPQAVSIEACGFAAWTRTDWLDGHPEMVRNIGAWVGEECAAFGIPLVRLNSQQAQGGGTGVCGHIDLGSWGGGHVDPDYGSGQFPWDEVMDIAGGSAATPPSTSPPGDAASAPAWPGRYLQLDEPMMEGDDVLQYQAQMSSRGWRIATDSWFGPESHEVTKSFQAEALGEGHDIGAPYPDGIVGPKTWALAWTKPIT